MIKDFPYIKVNEAVNEWATRELKKKKLKFDSDLPSYLQLKNHESKTISIRKREVTLANSFKVPTQDQNGFDKLKLAITNGENLNPYLSRKLFDANFVDGMLDYFNCYHFHLGVRKKGRFIQGTKHIAIAIVNLKEIFFVDVLPHGKSTWNSIDILEIIHNERPELIESFKVNLLKNTSHDVTTTEEIKLLKENGDNFPITLKDGTMYMAAKGGQVSTRYKPSEDSQFSIDEKIAPRFALFHFLQNQYLCRLIHQKILLELNKFINEKKFIIHDCYLCEFESDKDSNLTKFCLTIVFMKNLKFDRQTIVIYI